MACMDLETLGSEVLRQEAARIPKVTKRIKELARQMFDAMYESDGIGLAAPQIGLSKQLIVVDPQEEGSRPLALVNPRIVSTSEREVGFEEGCLSVPGVRAQVMRPEAIVVQALNMRGEPVELGADGLLARVLQHEIDHLRGVLFVDHLPPAEREQLLASYQRQNSPTGAG